MNDKSAQVWGQWLHAAILVFICGVVLAAAVQMQENRAGLAYITERQTVIMQNQAEILRLEREIRAEQQRQSEQQENE